MTLRVQQALICVPEGGGYSGKPGSALSALRSLLIMSIPTTTPPPPPSPSWLRWSATWALSS